MQVLHRFAATVTAGVAAFAVCVALQSPWFVAASAGVVYAVTAYVGAAHADALWEYERDSRAGFAWAVAAMLGFLAVAEAASYGLVVLVFGLTYFGFVVGLDYALDVA